MRAVPSLETGKNREERREQSYRLVFTPLTRKGTGPKALGVTVEGKPMCACLLPFEGVILTGWPPLLFLLAAVALVAVALVAVAVLAITGAVLAALAVFAAAATTTVALVVLVVVVLVVFFVFTGHGGSSLALRGVSHSGPTE